MSVDDLAREKVHEIEESLKNGSITNLKVDSFTKWLSILKQIITAADLHRTNDDKSNGSQRDEQDKKAETGDSIYADYGDDNEQFTTQVDLSEQFATNSVKWTIRVQAFKLAHRLVNQVLEANQGVKSPQALIKLLPDLVRLSFVAATSPYDELKMQGFEMFRVLIERFASYEEAEFPGHSILEQYKTQYLSAVKPAFNLDAPPYITAIASQICSLWICQGLEKNLSDVKRTYQLMLLSITKLEGQSVNQHSKLYTESELEQERVDILGAWAQLYITSKEPVLPEYHGKLSGMSTVDCTNLDSLVQSQIGTLVDKWWEAMKDYALLIMPAPRLIGTSHDNDKDDVYTREVALRLFSPTWPKITLALTIWLCNGEKQGTPKYCKFLCGIIMKELCKRSTTKTISGKDLPNSTILAIRSLDLLLSNDSMQSIPLDNLAIAQEFYRTLYNLTVLHARDSNRLVMRQTLDRLFGLIVQKINQNAKNVHYGLAKLISSLMFTMKAMEIASNEGSPLDLDINRMHLSVRLKNLLILIKSTPAIAMAEIPLQVALIAVFQEMLHFEHEATVSITSAEQLKELLLSIGDRSLRAHILDELYPELCDRVGVLIDGLFKIDKYTDADKVHLSQADNLLKSMRLLLGPIDYEQRKDKMVSYVQSTLRSLKSCDTRKKSELIDFIVNQNCALRKLYPDVELTPEAQQILESAINMQKANQDEKESKKPASKPVNSRPKVAKIALKADFSNFYNKKP